jgi:hypothetical protein
MRTNARELNQGSGHKISPEIRAIVYQELESFMVGHIHDQRGQLSQPN